jgi:uncharacterized protein (TIGR00251 family)
VYSAGEHSIVLRVRLSPSASRDGIEGTGETADGQRHLNVRVRAVPENGKANKALTDLLSKTLAVAKRDISVIKGHTSRLKTVSIQSDNKSRHHILELMEKLTDERTTD